MLKELAKHLWGTSPSSTSCRCRTGATKATGWATSRAASGRCSASASVGTRRDAERHGLSRRRPDPLGKGGTFVGQHVYTVRPGVTVQINAFNFPVWGMLEKLAPAFLAGTAEHREAGQPDGVPHRGSSSAGSSSPASLPEGSLQLLCGSPAGLLDELTVQDSVAFTGSAHTAGLLRTHTNVLHGGVPSASRRTR